MAFPARLLTPSKSTREGISQKVRAGILHNVITEVTSCHFCHILLVRSKSLVLSTVEGRSINTSRQDPGAVLKSDYSNLLSFPLSGLIEFVLS